MTISHLVATFVKSCGNLYNLSAIVIFSVAERSQRGRKFCVTRALYTFEAYNANSMDPDQTAPGFIVFAFMIKV